MDIIFGFLCSPGQSIVLYFCCTVLILLMGVYVYSVTLFLVVMNLCICFGLLQFCGVFLYLSFFLSSSLFFLSFLFFIILTFKFLNLLYFFYIIPLFAFPTVLFSLLLLLLLRLRGFSHIWLCATPQMAARQAPLSPGFSGRNTRVGCHFFLLSPCS